MFNVTTQGGVPLGQYYTFPEAQLACHRYAARRRERCLVWVEEEIVWTEPGHVRVLRWEVPHAVA